MAQQQIVYWWKSGTLFYAQATELNGADPSALYTSTDLPDVLEQVGYDRKRDIIRPNEAPDLTREVWA